MKGQGYSQEVVKIALRRRPLTDVYLYLLTSPWRVVFIGILLSYLVANALFALLYFVDGGIEGARPGSYADAYFFSVQTMATIGYGRMVPATTFSNLVVTIEALFGLVMLALGTSLMFSKFSQPRARVAFSRYAVVTVRDEQQVLMVRLANERATGLVEAQIHLVLVRDEVTKEGESVRRFHNLAVQRASSAVFALSWSVVHVIDEHSPIHGETSASLRASQADLVASLVGIEEATAQQVHARYTWRADDIHFGRRFRDIIVRLPDGRRGLDYGRFHDLDPETAPAADGAAPVAADAIKGTERARRRVY